MFFLLPTLPSKLFFRPSPSKSLYVFKQTHAMKCIPPRPFLVVGAGDPLAAPSHAPISVTWLLCLTLLLSLETSASAEKKIIANTLASQFPYLSTSKWSISTMSSIRSWSHTFKLSSPIITSPPKPRFQALHTDCLLPSPPQKLFNLDFLMKVAMSQSWEGLAKGPLTGAIGFRSVGRPRKKGAGEDTSRDPLF